MWIILLCVTLAFWIYLKGVKPLNYWKERGAPSTKPWPFLGDLVLSLLGRRALAHGHEDIYYAFPGSRYVGFFNLATPVLMVRDPELIKTITIKEFHTFPQHKPFIPEDADPLWSKNLFAMRGGEEWHNMRTTLSPAFTSSKIKIMFKLMGECATQFVNYFSKDQETVTVELKDAFTRLANDIIATTAFGIACDSLRQPENEFYVMGKSMTGLTVAKSIVIGLYSINPALSKFLKMSLLSESSRKFYSDIIKETIRTREEEKIVRPDMIHLLMEARKGHLKPDAAESDLGDLPESSTSKLPKVRKVDITDDDITAQAVVFFFAGFDSVSNTLCHACHELALDQSIQEKLREEVDRAFEDCDGQLTYEAVMGMKYLHMIVSETLRKWPAFVSTDRQAVKSFVIPPSSKEEPLHITPGLSLLIPIYSIQRDPKYYPNPDKFDPERFSEENKHKITPFTYLPFGAGPRDCIGSRFALIETKLVIAELLRKFEIVPVKETKAPIVISKNSFTTTSGNGFWVGLKPRVI